MDELAALLAKAKQTPAGRRPYQDVIYTVKNTDKSLDYQVSFPHKSPSDELKEKAMEEAQGAGPAAAAAKPAAPAEPAEAAMSDSFVYRTAGAEIRVPNKLASENVVKAAGSKVVTVLVPDAMFKVAEAKTVTVIVPEPMKVEAKKKNTKTVSEEKFVSCKEQVKEKSPGVNEYAVCTDSLGGQPASYHAKKDKKSSTDGKVAVASAGKDEVAALRKTYPDEFLKQMGIA